MLRSRLHGMASRWLALISYTGRRNGRERTLPVAYRRRSNQLIVASPKGGTDWWRNFEEPRTCTIWLHGRKTTAQGKRIVAPETHQTMLLSYFQKFGFLGWISGFGGNPVVSERALNRAKKSLVVVLFTLDQPHDGASKTGFRRGRSEPSSFVRRVRSSTSVRVKRGSWRILSPVLNSRIVVPGQEPRVCRAGPECRSRVVPERNPDRPVAQEPVRPPVAARRVPSLQPGN